MMAAISTLDVVGSLVLLVIITAIAFLWTWLLKDRDDERVPPHGLSAGNQLHVVQDIYLDGRIVAHRGERVTLASRVLYRDHGYCWSATSNGRHIFPIPEWALSVDSIQG